MRVYDAHRPRRFAWWLDLARGAAVPSPVASPRRSRLGLSPRAGKVAAMTDPAPLARRRSGSQTRQRSRSVNVALTDAERAKVEADAHALGLSLSGYARALLVGAVTPRTPRRPLPNATELARLLGQLGKVGSNLNQLTKLGNQGQLVPPSSLAACIAEVQAVTEQLAEVLTSDC